LTILAVILGHLPLAGAEDHPFTDYWDLLSVICDEPIPIPILDPPLSKELSEMITSCLDKKAELRPGVEELLEHSFFMNHSSVLWKALMCRSTSNDDESVKVIATSSSTSPSNGSNSKLMALDLGIRGASGSGGSSTVGGTGSGGRRVRTGVVSSEDGTRSFFSQKDKEISQQALCILRYSMHTIHTVSIAHTFLIASIISHDTFLSSQLSKS
jgi:serine/threonine protein kinase